MTHNHGPDPDGRTRVIRHRAARGPLAFLAALLLVVLAGSPVAAGARVRAPPYAERIDAIYLALAQGRAAQAAAAIATLERQRGLDDAQRVQLLTARMDLMREQGTIDKREGDALLRDVSALSRRDGAARILGELVEVSRSIAKGRAADAHARAVALAGSGASREAGNALARATFLLGQPDRAMALARANLVEWREVPGLRARWIEIDLRRLVGLALGRASRYDLALPELEQGVALALRHFGPDSAVYLSIETARAGTLDSVGDYGEAVKAREAVVAAARRLYGDEHAETGKAEAGIGATLERIGDYRNARAHYQRALAIYERVPDVPAVTRGLTLNNYANLLQEMGEEEEALDQYRKALDYWGDNPGTGHYRAVATANMGNTAFRLHRYAEANELFRKALVLREQADGKDNPGISYALEGLASSALALRRFDEAEANFTRALELRRRGLPTEHPTLTTATFGIALARWGQGDLAGAFDHARLTAEHQRKFLSGVAADLSGRQGVDYRALMMPATALAVTIAARLGDRASIEAAWRLAMLDRGVVAQAEARRLAYARAAPDPAQAQAWQRWRTANEALTQAWLRNDASEQSLAPLRLAVEVAERALGTARERGQWAPPDDVPTLAALAAALPPRGLLLAYVDGIENEPARLLETGRVPEPEDWYVFSLARDGVPRLARVGRVQALSAEVDGWTALLRDPRTDTAELDRRGRALRASLLGTIALPDRDATLFVAPEGELFRVPFAALPDRRATLLEQGVSVHTLAHERELLAPAPARGPVRALLAGAPEFTRGTSGTDGVAGEDCGASAAARLPPLPHAARELEALQALLSRGIARLGGVERLSGAAATRDEVVRRLPAHELVHLATHGFSVETHCTPSSPGQRALSLALADRSDRNDGNSTLTGLAFARGPGGQEPHADAQAGGIAVLSAAELSGVDLSRAQWVVLSACDTGVGPIRRNEGVFGMRRAVRLAGAPSVVMSLWPVDDAATTDLMLGLYRARFVKRQAVPTALSSAMRGVIAQRRAAGLSVHPYYWAAFVTEGSWR